MFVTLREQMHALGMERISCSTVTLCARSQFSRSNPLRRKLPRGERQNHGTISDFDIRSPPFTVSLTTALSAKPSHARVGLGGLDSCSKSLVQEMTGTSTSNITYAIDLYNTLTVTQ